MRSLILKTSRRFSAARHAHRRKALRWPSPPAIKQSLGGCDACCGRGFLIAIGKQTVVDFERGARVPHANNLIAIRRALEAAGVEFLPDNGVRLRTGSTGGQ